MMAEAGQSKTVVYHGNGCLRCGNTGYRGRLAVHEVMPMTSRLREMVVRRAATSELAKAAMEEGMQTMQQDALQKVHAGLTSVAEMMRVTYSDTGE
jgi:type IV pilus assembly protein PilB